MIGIVGSLLRQFGPTSASSPPASPALAVSDNGDGTATATVSGSTAGSTNDVYVMSAGASTWTLAGSRTGNGSVTLTLVDGRYFVYILSTLSSQQAVSEVDVIYLNSGVASDLTHSPADVVRHLMIAMGLATLPTDNAAWPAWEGSEPNEPDNLITVYNTSGRTQGSLQANGEVQEFFGIQVRLRATRENIGWSKMRTLVTALDEQVSLDTVVIESSEYLVYAISRTSGILSLGKDVPMGKCNLFTINAVVSLRQQN